jgi:hypothetical protein
MTDRLHIRKLNKRKRLQASKALKSLDWKDWKLSDDKPLAPIRAGLKSINPKHLSDSEKHTLEFLRLVSAWLAGDLD